MVDYEFYSTVYYGDKLEDNNEFKRLAMDAELTVDHFSFGRLSGEIPYEITPEVEKLVKLTICKLMDYQFDYDNRDKVKSISSGPYSKTYEDGPNEEELSNFQEDIVRRNLSKTELLNRYMVVW